MKTTLRLLGAAALCFALAPLSFAQDCSRIATSTGAVDMAYAHCAQSPVVETLRSGPSDLSFGHNASTSNIVTFPQNAPQVLTPVGPGYVAPVFLNAGDFGATLTTWFGLDSGGQAISVNMMTGAVTVLGTIAPPGGGSWTGLTYDSSSGTFYATSSVCGTSSSLSTVNFGALSSTLIGVGGAALTCAISIASNAAGTLYAVDIVLDQLVTLSKTTGAATVVGPLGFDANFGQGMDFDDQDGSLYQYSFNATTFVPELRRSTPPLNGSSTVIGVLGATTPGGLNQLGAASSKTSGVVQPNFVVDANPEAQSVPQGGVASFTVKVTNNTANPATGQICYKAGPLAPVLIASGTVPAGGMSPNIPVSINVPGSTPVGTYTVNFRAGPNCTTIIAFDDVLVTVTPSGNAPIDPMSEWTLAAPVEWPTFETAARTSEVGAFPNPFVDRTEIAYSLEAGTQVRLTVYDVLGREVAVLTDEVMEAGSHTATFDARGLATGTYIYRLVAGNEVQSGRITLMK